MAWRPIRYEFLNKHFKQNPIKCSATMIINFVVADLNIKPNAALHVVGIYRTFFLLTIAREHLNCLFNLIKLFLTKLVQ